MVEVGPVHFFSNLYYNRAVAVPCECFAITSCSLCSSSYLGLQVISLVLGFMSGNWTLLPYITSEVVGVDKFTEAYGILMFFGGVGLTLGPPLVGKVAWSWSWTWTWM